MKNQSIISISQAAVLLGVHIDSLRNWEKKGILIPMTTRGGHRRYYEMEIQKMIGMNMSEKIIKKWEDTGLLYGIGQDRKKVIATCLENQRIFNQESIGKPDESSKIQFLRMSFPVVRRVMGATKIDLGANIFRDWSDYHITDLDWNFFESNDLESLSKYVSDLSERIIEYINKKNKLDFKALGVIDGKVTIYGTLS